MHDNNLSTAITLLIKGAAEGNPHPEAVLDLGETPKYLIDIGFQQLRVVITGSTVDKAHFDHGITKPILARLPELIANPKGLYRSATQPNSAVVVSFEQKDGSPLLLPIRKDKMVGRTQCNVVSSVYTKEAEIEKRWQAAGLLLWTRSAPPKT